MLLGCSTPRAAVVPTHVLRDTHTTVTIRAVDGPLAVADLDVVAAAIPAARARLLRWHLSWAHDVTLTLHGSVHGFIQATGQTVPTLRAWSTWRDVHLLTTDTWRAADNDEVRRRLTHELCHLAVWHRAGSAAVARSLPRLLTEGVCSVVADQGRERLDVDSVLTDLDDGRAVDFDDDSVFAYAVAHHVVAGLARCHGDDAVVALIDAVTARDPTTAATLVDFLPAPPRELVGACRRAR